MNTKSICSLLLMLLLYCFVYPQTWPILQADDPDQYYIISGTMGEIHGDHFHEAIDINCDENYDLDGVEIRPIEDGVVIYPGSYSILIGHNHNGNHYERFSRYLHITPNETLVAGTEVTQGSTILGHVDGVLIGGYRNDHLHLEMGDYIGNHGLIGNEDILLHPLSNNSGWQLELPTDHPDDYPPQINDIIVEALNNQSNNVQSGFSVLDPNNNDGVINYPNITGPYRKVHVANTLYGCNFSMGPIYNFQIEKLVIWGNVAFIVNARDIGINYAPGNGIGGGPGLTVKRIEYSICDVGYNSQTKYVVDFSEILHEERNAINELFHYPYFDPDNYLYGNNDFIEMRSTNDTYLHIHQQINQIQSNGIWFTKALNTTPHVFNQTPTQIALVNELALYSDGEQNLNFCVTDASGQDDSYDLQLIVDNYIPFIKKVEIYTDENLTEPEYERSWIWQGTQYVLEGNPICSFSDIDDVWIKLICSEPMQNIELTLNNFYENKTQYFDANGIEWLFHVSSNYLIVGENNLEINGFDLAENGVSGNPEILSVHQTNGQWLPMVVQGPDVFHSFSVATSNTITEIDFEADNLFPDPGEWVFFTSYTQSEDVTYEWDFEHPSNISVIYALGFTQNSQDIKVYFTGANSGQISVSLTVSNEISSLTETKEDYIQITNSSINPPYPEFSTINGLTSISAGHSIDFTDLSLNDPTYWYWQFEGGIPGTSILKNPQDIFYSTPGFYNVSLQVYNGSGGVLTLVKEDYIVVYEVLQVLNTDCWVDQNIVSLNEPLTFFATMYDGLPPYSVTINFDNEEIFSFITDEFTISESFTFSTPGNKTITVGVSDASSPGKTGNCYTSISVSQVGPMHTVDFSWNPPNPLLSEDISFQNLTTGPPGVNLNNSYWQWFADPVTGNMPVYPSPVPYSEILYNINAMNNPSTHAKYDELGSYPVTLTVSDQYGWQGMKTKYINFSEGIRCVFFDDPGIGVSLIPVIPTNQNLSFWANAGCCSDPGCAYYDYLREITDIRWKLFNASTGEYIANSEVHKSNPATCSELSPAGGGQGLGWFWNEYSHRTFDYSGFTEKGDYYVQCEIWCTCNDEEIYNVSLEPSMDPQLPYYEVTRHPFKVVDCDEVVNFSLIVNNGNMEIWGGTINLGGLVLSGSGLSCIGHEEINMVNGFNALNGSIFSAQIIPCPDCKDSLIHTRKIFTEKDFEENLTEITSFEVGYEQPIKIFPNPTNSLINIILSPLTDEIVNIELRQMNGKILMVEQSLNSGKATLNLSELPKGIYLLSIKTNENFFNEKIVLQ